MKNLIKSSFLVLSISGAAGYASYLFMGNFWFTFSFFVLMQYVLYSVVLSAITNYFKEKTKQKELDKLENLSTILDCAYCSTKNVMTFIPDQYEKIQFKCSGCNNNNSVVIQFMVARTTEPLEIKPLTQIN
jgi:hypothetical protein